MKLVHMHVADASLQKSEFCT